jgi:hypothetical protein
MKENPHIKLNILEEYDMEGRNESAFAHSKIGYNEDPVSKMSMFSYFIKNNADKNINIAFLKFCYVDVTSITDGKKLAQKYIYTLDDLKKKYPNTTFVHFTVPLTTIQTGIKANIKKIIGRTLGGYEENIKRNIYNRMIIEKYFGKEPVFDLASIESTSPDGKRVFFNSAGEKYFYLFPEYTDDGGHLNKLGRKIIAEQLIIFLSKL